MIYFVFFVLQKSSLLSSPWHLFLEIFLFQPPVMFLTQLDKREYNFTKRGYKIDIKRDSTAKKFLEVTKGIEHLQQNVLDKLRFSDPNSKQVY